MTDMKRTTVSLPDDVVEAIGKLRSTEKFKRCTYSEIIRQCIREGLPGIAELASEEKGA